MRNLKSERFILVKLLNKIKSECEELLGETISDKKQNGSKLGLSMEFTS